MTFSDELEEKLEKHYDKFNKEIGSKLGLAIAVEKASALEQNTDLLDINTWPVTRDVDSDWNALINKIGVLLSPILTCKKSVLYSNDIVTVDMGNDVQPVSTGSNVAASAAPYNKYNFFNRYSHLPFFHKLVISLGFSPSLIAKALNHIKNTMPGFQQMQKYERLTIIPPSTGNMPNHTAKHCSLCATLENEDKKFCPYLMADAYDLNRFSDGMSKKQRMKPFNRTITTIGHLLSSSSYLTPMGNASFTKEKEDSSFNTFKTILYFSIG